MPKKPAPYWKGEAKKIRNRTLAEINRCFRPKMGQSDLGRVLDGRPTINAGNGMFDTGYTTAERAIVLYARALGVPFEVARAKVEEHRRILLQDN